MTPPRQPPRAIVTHPAPDLDALLSVYLLRRHGGHRFPGVEACPLRFMAPAEVEDAGGAEVLEAAGDLVVDIGGGRFDNHPRAGVPDSGDLEASAAELVAEHLGVRQRRELGKLLEFCSRQDLRGESIHSRDPVDHAIALPAVIAGLNLLHPDDGAEVYRAVEPVLDAIVATEAAWFEALDDARRARRSDVGGVQVMSMESRSPAAARAGRYLGADLLVVRYLPHGHVACTMRRDGKLRGMTLEGLARRFRRAESRARGRGGDGTGAVGMHDGWFLHQSRRILNKGSPKAPDVEATCLGLEQLHDMARAEVATYVGKGPRRRP